MEEYLNNMKTLRSQMNDVEDQAAKISVDEQTQITAIHTMEMDLNLAKSDTKRLQEETNRMVNEKGQVCSQILDKQKRIVSLEADTSTLSQNRKEIQMETNNRTGFVKQITSQKLLDNMVLPSPLQQTLELMQQERITLSAKLIERRSYYAKVVENLNAKLQEQQDWMNSANLETEVGELRVVEEKLDEQMCEIKGKAINEIDALTDNQNYKDLRSKLDSATSKLEEMRTNKSTLVLEHKKMEQSIQQLKSNIDSFRPELVAMDNKALEEEHRALMSDKAGETEYLQSLQYQINKLKGISHVIRCVCGEEYKVEMGING